MKHYIHKGYLVITGLTMMAVASYIALMPTDYLASMNSEIQSTTLHSINMLSELRGMGGMMLVFGVYIFCSSFRNAWLPQALVISTAVYASFALFRTLGFLLDGAPQSGILVAYFIEITIAGLGMLLLSHKGRAREIEA